MTAPEQTRLIPRDLLAKYFGRDPRLMRAFEEQARTVVETADGQTDTASALDLADVVTLSPNDIFSNEHVLANGDGTKIEAPAGSLKISVDATVARVTGFSARFQPDGDVTLGLPLEGVLVSDAAPATMYQKTLDKPKLAGLVSATNDTNAAASGVPIGGIYHNAGALRIRLV